MIRYLRNLFIAIMLVCGIRSSVFALDNSRISSQFQFNFITPGARATALGGAFIGLADDATAVESNPAGLTILTEPEVSAELKYFHYTIEHGMYTGGWGGYTTKSFDNSVISVPFVSYVYPFKRFVLSIYRQELVNYEYSFSSSSDAIDWDGSVELLVTNYGIGAAMQISDAFSLAFSPRLSHINMKLRYTEFDDRCPSWFDEWFGECGDIYQEELMDDANTEFSLNTGLLWNPHPRISIGAVYKSGAEFTLKLTCSRGWGCVGNPDREYTVNVPNSFGVGVAFRVTDLLTFTLDVAHIQYRDLLKDFDTVDVIGTEDSYTINNATETHFGAEYFLILGKTFLALRAGIYNDPEHNLRYTDSFAESAAHHPEGEDQIHVTGGLGLVLSDRFQIDTAMDIADKRKQFSFSAVYRFGTKKPKIPKKKPDLAPPVISPPVEETLPSITFTVVKFDKTLEIQSITADTPGISDANVTIKQAGKTKFIVTAALEKDQQTFTTDIEIRMGFQSFTVKEIDKRGQVKVLSEKGKSVEVMVTFNE